MEFLTHYKMVFLGRLAKHGNVVYLFVMVGWEGGGVSF